MCKIKTKNNLYVHLHLHSPFLPKLRLPPKYIAQNDCLSSPTIQPVPAQQCIWNNCGPSGKFLGCWESTLIALNQ